MPVGYLITVLVVATFTAVALAPPTRPRVAAYAAYLMGMVVNEVPHLAAGLALATATATALVEGDLGRDGASLALLVAAGAVMVGLGVVAARGIRSWSSVTEGLRTAGIASPDAPRAWALRTALTPIPFQPHAVARIADLRYGDHRRQRLDVYHRRDRPAGGPVLVYLHGGGYNSGSKHHEGRALLHRLAARGWVCVSATYRLRPRAGFEEHLADARAALAWARAHATDYGADPSTLVLAGSSAGAHLASLLALDPDRRPTAAICLYGYYGRYYGHTVAEPVPSTPFALSAAGAPPFFIAHGDRDSLTPVEASRALTTKLREESPGPVVGVVLRGGQHGFDLLHSWRYSAVLAGVDAFLADPRVGIRLA
ncbi:alpha/beta hydrolase [Georgenia wangjunii]|uniref:alpha/beta hydrolase n=1 Tax=Georgenia wangjunii TaxID=3117730 RepID=UPI002F26CA7D